MKFRWRNAHPNSWLTDAVLLTRLSQLGSSVAGKSFRISGEI